MLIPHFGHSPLVFPVPLSLSRVLLIPFFNLQQQDLEHVDDQIYRNFSELVNLDDVGMLYLEFVVTEDKLGVTETVDLIPGGEFSAVYFDCMWLHDIFWLHVMRRPHIR